MQTARLIPQRKIITSACKNYRYRVTNTRKSSDHYGNCEVCEKPVVEVHIQTESRHYRRTSDGVESWTHHGCHSLFGHQKCLEQQRK